MLERRDSILLLIGTVVALNTTMIAFNSYRLTIMRIEQGLDRFDDQILLGDVKALKDWRQLTQSNRFTSEHGAQLRNDMDINVGALVQRIEALERERNDRK